MARQVDESKPPDSNTMAFFICNLCQALWSMTILIINVFYANIYKMLNKKLRDFL